jgi:hypothetical protein
VDGLSVRYSIMRSHMVLVVFKLQGVVIPELAHGNLILGQLARSDFSVR